MRTGPLDDDALAALLEQWVPAQRWFSAKGVDVGLAVRGTVVMSAADDVVVATHVVAVTGAAGEQLVQVPLVYRGGDVAAVTTPAVGSVEAADGRGWLVLDGPHDAAYVAALLALLDGGATEDGPTGAAGHLAAGATAPGAAVESKVLSGEQSNTSIIVTPEAGPPIIVKVFRTLAAGDNPDVVVQAALAGVASTRIPAPVGWVEGTWPSGPGADGENVHGHLAVAAEMLHGSQDAWREALEAVTGGRSFADQARELGAATGEVHLSLARALPTRAATPEDGERLAASLRDRAAWALEAAPVLVELAGPLWARLDDAPALLSPGSPGTEDAAVLALQQVHGDLHLGQVLHAPGRGWVLLDFEGEPLRPLAERTQPDLALRDVAGMLRSFDYAAASAQLDGVAGEAALTWGEQAREAFCEGYAAATGADPRERRGLLDALELDKALYEVVYETRNRPSWVPVPLGAVRRLLAG